MRDIFYKVGFAILIIGCLSVLGEWYYDLKLKPPKIVKEIVEVDNGWHLPEIKGYVAEIKYKKL